ncbi:hypothetical protein BS47DRAFT_1367877 [Hydnum rufescens UP504]|uniref:Uncharacterized protein n=1 Tax=Hydnum rufescens UP504 TaxID=1448309 RepID=A0A9P6AH48_9AGAM|nr:hypothetical protein BS47DRAFT_1367877 [Hydnum rufescens UP504]
MKPTTKSWGVSLQHAALTLQLADVAIRGLGDPESHFEDMDLLRNGVFELAVHLGAIPAPLTSMPPEDSLGSLIQTNAEQAKALAQNANSIAALTCILESQPTATATPLMGMPSNLSESIHAPVKWSSHLKRSDHPLPIKPSPKKKAPTASIPANPSQRPHGCHLIEFYLKIGREIVSKINSALTVKGACKEDRIDAIQWSLNGNTVVIMSETTNAEAMKDYYGVIASLFSPNIFKAHPDYVYHRVKLDQVSTWVDGEHTTIERVTEELTEKWARFSTLTQHRKPSWLRHESIISKQSSAPITISFASEESATIFKDQDWPSMYHMYKC